MASGSVITRLVRFAYSTHAGCGIAIHTGCPLTRNLMSTASAWRVAIATISAWYRQCSFSAVHRSVTWKSSYIPHKTIAERAGTGKRRGATHDYSRSVRNHESSLD